MANSFQLPFNHAPSGIDYGNLSRTYTCPAGKYARVVVSLCARTYGSLVLHHTGSSALDGNTATDSSTDSKTFEFWLIAGNLIAVSGGSTGDTGSAGVSGAGTVLKASNANASVSLAGQTVARVNANISLTVGHPNIAFTSVWNLYASHTAEFHVEEYDIIT